MSETILDNLLKEIKDDDIDLQIQKICNKIQEEEDQKINDENESKKLRPDFPNIFLVLHGRTTKNDFLYLTLEREFPEKYIIGVWSKTLYNDKPTKRIRSFEIKEVKPNKIIKEFAKVYKTYQ